MKYSILLLSIVCSQDFVLPGLCETCSVQNVQSSPEIEMLWQGYTSKFKRKTWVTDVELALFALPNSEQIAILRDLTGSNDQVNRPAVLHFDSHSRHDQNGEQLLAFARTARRIEGLLVDLRGNKKPRGRILAELKRICGDEAVGNCFANEVGTSFDDAPTH